MPACVPNRMRGCLPPRIGCGCAATSSPRKAFSRPVGTRVSQPASAVSIAGTSFSMWRPVRAETLTRGAHWTWTRSRLDLPLQVEAALLVELVPLVVRDDAGAAGVDDHRHDPGVLHRERLAGVDQHDRDLGLLQGGRGAQRGVVVGALGRWTRRRMPAVSTNFQVSPAEFDQLVDRVAGGAGDRVDDDALVAGELVEQRGLADVGPADQRDRARPPTASSKVCAGVSGSASRTASSRSPLPRPCSAETA